MKEAANPQPDALSGDERWKLVLRVASTPRFRRSSQLREFLLYICDRALRNRLDEVTEQQIGCNVLGRRPDYNPGEDNIVRVQARQLRSRLQEYFATEGIAETLVIDIPKGSYIPVFHARPQAPTGAPEGKSPVRGAWLSRKLLGRAIILLLLAGCAWLWQENRQLRRASTAEPEATSALGFPWSEVLDRKHQTAVVVADSCFALLQDITQRPASLNDYLSSKHFSKSSAPEDKGGGIESLVASRQFTSFADVAITARILRLSEGFRDRISVRYARDLQLRDFKSGHFILIGSSRSNPWVELFDHSRNFRSQFDQQTRQPYFVNKAPRPGEQAAYLTSGKDGTPGETYGLLAFLPNLGQGGNVLIIEGTNMEGTEAAGEYLMNPETSRKLLAALGAHGSGAGPRYFEVLLRTSALAGTSRDTDIIATRSLGEVRPP